MIITEEQLKTLPEDAQKRISELGKPRTAPHPTHGMLIQAYEVNESVLEEPGLRGVGDLVALFAKPIAKVLGMEGCGGCAQRQEALNKALPFS